MSIEKGQYRRPHRKIHKSPIKFLWSILKKLIEVLYRNRYKLQRNFASFQRGFVLPVTMMVLVVLSLVVATVLINTNQEVNQVIGKKETEKINNAASPALDRAKAKLEYLFEKDPQFPSGIPGKDNDIRVEDLLLNNDADYTLPDETRIDINGDTVLDNAWAYDTDVDGDGKAETVAYSILMRTGVDFNNNNQIDSSETIDNIDSAQTKAENLMVRNGPLRVSANSSFLDCLSVINSGDNNNSNATTIQEQWYELNSASLVQAFQIDAVVANKNEINRNVTALELQQDRQIDRGNKWGAWFRYDLELFPGPNFNWNGAMYSGGNIMLGQQSDKIHLHLISAPKSCLYTPDASDITLAEYDNEGDPNKPIFQGQIMTFDSKNNSFGGDAKVDLYPGPGQAPSNSDKIKLTNSNDSVNDSKGKPYDFSLDPITLFTQGLSKSRYGNDNTSVRDSNWENQSLHQRIFNQTQATPYVDDTYRADSRYGPKPGYAKPGNPQSVTVTKTKYGKAIEDPQYLNLLTEDNPPATTPGDVGLDGYWERRARVEGLRLIVGQRLELGNANGWEGNNDALYPINSSLSNEDRQRKTLRDNLAAVQAMAVYHVADDQDFPSACVAVTAHPGTSQTITDSTTFNNITVGTETRIDTNFIEGTGTNGWEFLPPANNTGDFVSKIASNQPLGIALRNLAYFAGDPDGAFPPKQEAGGSIVHPYPYLTMWGNYSNLRRVVDLLDNQGKTYYDLSLADKTTLHTAACTLGMLANNIKNAEDEYNSLIANNQSGIVSFGQHIWKLVDGNESNGEVNKLISPQVSFPNGYDRQKTCSSPTDMTCAANFYAQFTPEDYQEAILNDNSLNTSKKNELIGTLSAFAKGLPIVRDRRLGFAPNGDVGGSINWDPVTGEVSAGSGGTAATLKVGCDPNTFDDYFAGGGGGLDDKKVGLSLEVCPYASFTSARYPALYYLFPKNNHDQIVNQPPNEEYIADTYIYDSLNSTGINYGVEYKVLEDTNNNGTEDGNENGIAEIALTPRPLDQWKLPKTTVNTNTENKITFAGTSYYVPFLDKGIYQGRELMGIRVLDVDLDMLRKNPVAGEPWLPKSGIVYAFREDAVSEDAIARPANKTWSECNQETKISRVDSVGPDNGCVMNVNTPQDPPVNDNTGVSPKPVDYYPDPDRRPHGFRLKNGKSLQRIPKPAASEDRGLSFISNNPVYIQGDFNLHENSGGSLLEEFTQKLNDNWNNFYTRTTLDTNFAKSATDNWRPTEVLADALTILSDNFCDGTIESGIKNDNNNNANCGGGDSKSSYRNSTTNNNGGNWKRETSDSNSPIKVNRKGQPLFNNGNPDTAYKSMQDGRTIGKGVNGQRINTVFISGLVPSRPNQSYGGLHNFPRFLEKWSGKNLYISGSFIQLDFSSYATAPFDLEAASWEPGGDGQSGEKLPYYGAPNRRWGYDVALQYNPPGPITKRFISKGIPRSEFYQKVASDDPYIKQLRCATYKGNKVDSKAQDCPSN